MKHSVSVVEISEQDPSVLAGGLTGWRMVCTCGLVFSTSLSRAQADREVREHLAWHERQAAEQFLRDHVVVITVGFPATAVK